MTALKPAFLPPLGAAGFARERFLALVLLTVAAYRAPSPLADMLLGGSVFGFLAAIVALLAYLWRYGRITGGREGIAVPVPVKLAFAILAGVLLVHAAVHPSSAPPDAKYLALLALTYAALAYLPGSWYRAWFNGQTLLLAGYFAVALLIVVGLYLDWLDLDDWRANKASLLPGSNILRQMADAGNETYLVLYSLTVPKFDSRYEVLGIEFVRFTGLFLEPTDAAMVILPLFFFAMDRARNADARMRVLALCMLAMALAAFAYSGFIALLAAGGLIVFTRRLADARTTALARLVLSATAGAAMLALVVAPEQVIGAISEAKRVEFLSRKAQFLESLGTYANPGPFGLGVYQSKEGYVHSYGLLSVWLQYGYAGSAALGCFLIPFVRAAWGLLGTPRYWIGGLAFASLVLFFKTSEIVNLLFLATYAFVIQASVRQTHANSPAASGAGPLRRVAPQAAPAPIAT